MPFSAAALVLKSASVRDFFSIPGLESCLPLLAVAIVCLFATMNIMTAPSISLEGKNLWIAQSMPVSGSQVLRAKLHLHLLLTFLPAIPLVAVLEWLTKPGLVYGILIPVVSALFALLMAEIGHYESEQYTKEIFYSIIRDLFPNFALQLSKINTNPIKYL